VVVHLVQTEFNWIFLCNH